MPLTFPLLIHAIRHFADLSRSLYSIHRQPSTGILLRNQLHHHLCLQ